MGLFSKLNYVLEILLAELVFLSAFPRRKIFVPRIVPAVAVSCAVGYTIPFRAGDGYPALQFAIMLLTLAVTVAGMYFSFSGSFLSVLSACCAGVAVQHIGHHLSRLISLLPFVGVWNSILEFLTCSVLCVIVFLTLGRMLKKDNAYETADISVTVVSVLIVLICIGITRFLRLGGALNLYVTICTSLYAITCCLLALFIRFFLHRFIRLKSEHMILQHIREEERRQFELDRENAELLSVKCHDLKHMLLSLEARFSKEEINSLREIVESYDNTYHTGLDVLDIILNEKYSRCRSKDIQLTCMGSGAELGFMDIMDVYSLFGNILENAITAVEKIDIPGKRLISLIIEQKGSFVMISAMNYSNTESLTFTDGLPNTTKEGEPGYHGYGLKSIQLIAKKYSGDILVSASNGMFQVNVYMVSELA